MRLSQNVKLKNNGHKIFLNMNLMKLNMKYVESFDY